MSSYNTSSYHPTLICCSYELARRVRGAYGQPDVFVLRVNGSEHPVESVAGVRVQPSSIGQLVTSAAAQGLSSKESGTLTIDATSGIVIGGSLSQVLYLAGVRVVTSVTTYSGRVSASSGEPRKLLRTPLDGW